MTNLSSAKKTVAAEGNVSTADRTTSPGWTLGIIAVGNFLATLDLFIVNLAFPAIRNDFPGTTNQSLSWVLTIYSIFFAALLVPSGRMADRFGRKQMFQAGLMLFAIGSAACALAPTVSFLVIARAVKGAGAALMIPTSLGLLLAAYPPERHKQMVGVWAAIGSIGAAMGPAIGGILLQYDWRFVFLVNLPFAIPAIWFSHRLKESAKTKSEIPDLIGSALFAAAVGGVVAVISYAADWGFQSATFWVVTILSVVCFFAFIWRCLHMKTPALDLRVFRVPAFAIAVIGLAFFYMGFSVSLLGGTLFLIQVWHLTPMAAGIAFAVGPAVAGLTAFSSSRMRFTSETLALAGCGFVGAGTLFWYLGLHEEGRYAVNFLPGLVLLGFGAGTAQAGFLASGASALDASEYSTGTGILNTARQVGGAVGVALFVAVTGTASHASQFANAWVAIVTTSVVAALAAIGMQRAKG